MKMKNLGVFLSIFFVITSCTLSPEALDTQTAEAWTPTPNATQIPTMTLAPTPTLITWQTYIMNYSIEIGGIGKLWMPVPKNWNGIGMTNVEIIEITPVPDDLFEDQHGNMIAYWNVGYQREREYSIKFSIEVSEIGYDFDIDQIGQYDNMSKEYLTYTQQSKMIQSNNVEIIKLAEEIVGNETNPFSQVKLIHKWVSENIKSGGLGDAVTVLSRKAGDCGGHSHLFIALLRSLGIPARNVNGLHTAYKNYFETGEAIPGHIDENTLFMHIWSEFFIPGYGWIQSDTSAGNQNFDGINDPRIILSRGEDIELGYGYPLGSVPFFNSPQQDRMNSSNPPTQTWGNRLSLIVERLN